jgi:hypothetical protein
MLMAGPVRDATFHPIRAEPRFPALEWRMPMTVWVGVSMLLGVGWPIALLQPAWSVGFLLAIGLMLAVAATVLTLAGAIQAGVPPRARRDVVVLTLAYGAGASLLAPFVAGFFSGAIGSTGYGLDMAAALWPLCLLIGAPCALIAGLILSLVAFRKPERPEPGVLQAEAQPGRDVVVQGSSRDVGPF